MLAKLLKYDLKWVYSLILVFYALAIVFGLLARLTMLFDESLVFNIINKVLAATSISMCISALINTITRSWIRFTRGVYGDESYLTHTLPVSKTDIYLSKIITSIIVSITTVLLTIICFLLCYYSKEFLDGIKVLLEQGSIMLDITVGQLLFWLVLVIFVELIYILFIGFTSVIIGHRLNQNKMGLSVLFGFVIYMIGQILMLVFIFLYALIFNNGVLQMFNSNMIDSISTVKLLIVICVCCYLIMNIAIFVIGKFQLDKGVNVD